MNILAKHSQLSEILSTNALVAGQYLSEQPKFKRWLMSEKSLTQQLRSLPGRFSVEVLSEHQIEHFDSAEPLWIREVLLKIDGVNWVFARSIIPSLLYQHHFKELGNRPLGELLYHKSLFKQTACIYRHIDKPELIHQDLNIEQAIWGRQREFSHAEGKVLVSEFFLPDANQGCEHIPHNLI